MQKVAVGRADIRRVIAEKTGALHGHGELCADPSTSGLVIVNVESLVLRGGGLVGTGLYGGTVICDTKDRRGNGSVASCIQILRNSAAAEKLH